ncbi:MAG: tRNA (adenosine(37)-N6)-threonylcarbamoyltransferase complex dimerization subunit type 1 TsaB [Tannerella sp.]|jgi:tRNA threonylcarbamoyladenosine biosynthesis protein TsaB|nr:tRNA (adenosine(37)-N6)-threonylcarbamoyltransferase complex dimerization subunit type 1 TsaB [Tannerella sp.]
MACILHIETSTAVCSAALSKDGEVIASKASYEGPGHAALLGVFVKELLAEGERRGLKPEAVAVSQGPGSYTGLRIGTSLAKGLCFGRGLPLLAVPTLQLLASAALKRPELPADEGLLLCPMIDARRMEVYAALYDRKLQRVRAPQADIVTADTYATFLAEHQVCFFGNGAAKCRPLIATDKAVFLDDLVPLAADMAPLAEAAFAASRFEDTAYFVPFYLKDFQASIPKNPLLNLVKN